MSELLSGGYFTTREEVQMAASVVLACLGIFGLSKFSGGEEAGRYNADTEAALQHAIRPTMVKIAEKATSLVAEKPLRYANPNQGLRVNKGYSDNPDEARIVVINNRFGINRRMDVVMGVQRNGNPDPEAARFIETNVSYVSPITGDKKSSGTYLAAPDSEPEDSRLTGPLSVGDSHGDGWSAGSIGTTVSDGEAVLGGGYLLDSSDSDFFKSDFSFQPTDPITTAKYVIKRDVLYDYNNILYP